MCKVPTKRELRIAAWLVHAAGGEPVAQVRKGGVAHMSVHSAHCTLRACGQGMADQRPGGLQQAWRCRPAPSSCFLCAFGAFRPAQKTGTDKITSHNYETMYGRLFELPPGRRNIRKMLEIGLGCNMNYGPGASAHIWRDYFPNTDIWMAGMWVSSMVVCMGLAPAWAAAAAASCSGSHGLSTACTWAILLAWGPGWVGGDRGVWCPPPPPPRPRNSPPPPLHPFLPSPLDVLTPSPTRPPHTPCQSTTLLV